MIEEVEEDIESNQLAPQFYNSSHLVNKHENRPDRKSMDQLQNWWQ